MSTIEVMRKALEALVWEVGSEPSLYEAKTDDAITALRAELERLEAVEPVAWLYEDTLPREYPYDAMFPHSQVRGGVRMFPVFAPIAPAIPEPVQVPDTGLPWLPALGELVCAAKDREAAWADQERAIDAAHCKLFRLLRAATPAPATIPALTIEEVAEGAPGFADVPKYGPAYLAGAHWAYTLAAARCGARIKEEK